MPYLVLITNKLMSVGIYIMSIWKKPSKLKAFRLDYPSLLAKSLLLAWEHNKLRNIPFLSSFRYHLPSKGFDFLENLSTVQYSQVSKYLIPVFPQNSVTLSNLMYSRSWSSKLFHHLLWNRYSPLWHRKGFFHPPMYRHGQCSLNYNFRHKKNCFTIFSKELVTLF